MASQRTSTIAALAIAAVGLGVAVGGLLGLGVALAFATVARLVEGHGWLAARDREALATIAGGGAIVGALALGGALLLSAPVGAFLGRGVEWSTLPVVRGSIAQTATLIILLVAIAIGGELLLRRWWLELVAAALVRLGASRSLALAGGVVAAALVEASLAPLGGDARGVGMSAIGLGVLYLAAGRRLGASVAARLVFEIGAVLLQALRLVG